MADALIAADLDLPLDVLLNLPAEVALDLEVLLDVPANPGSLVFGEILHLGVRAQAQLLADLLGASETDTEDIGEADLKPLVAGKINACDSSHSITPDAACDAGSDRSPKRGHAAG